MHKSSSHRTNIKRQHDGVSDLKQLVRKLVTKYEKNSATDTDKDVFLISFKETFSAVHSKQDFNDMMEIYHVISSYIPSLHVHVGALLVRLGLLEEAMACFRCGIDSVPDDLSAIFQLENTCCALVERWHFRMLNDLRRNSNYKEAISAAISTGHCNVLDIGTGTGLLACFCCKSGAKKPVYCCDDSNTMCSIASAVFSRNGLPTTNIDLIKLRSTNLSIPRDLPERVSLVVTEIFDSALFGEGILPTLDHAWRELLLPPRSGTTDTDHPTAGLVVPASASIYGCAIESRNIRIENRLVVDRSYRHISSLADMDFIAVCKTNCEDNYQISYPEESDDDSEVSRDDNLFENYTTERLNSLRYGYQQLSKEVLLLKVDFNDPFQIKSLIKGEFNLELELEIKKPGFVDAIGVWFDLNLSDSSPKRVIGNRPNAHVDSCWEQAIFPVLPNHLPANEKTFYADVGDTVKIKCRLEEEGKRLYVRCSDIKRSSTKNAVNPAKQMNIEQPLVAAFSRSAIRHLNDLETNFAMCRLLEFARNVDECNSVLLLSSTPNFLGIQAALMGYKRVLQLVPHSNDVLTLSSLAARIIASANNKVSSQNYTVPEYFVGPIENLIDGQSVSKMGGLYDLIVAELIDPCGVLHQQSVEELQLAKMILSRPVCDKSNKPGLFAPARLRIYGSFIESDELFESAIIVKGNNDGVECSPSCKCSRTCQVHVADFINLYRVRNHFNVDIHALKHRSLSEQFLIFDIDLDERCETKSDTEKEKKPSWLKSASEKVITLTATGRLAALVYWFEIDLVDSATCRRYTKSSLNNCNINEMFSDGLNLIPSIFTISSFEKSRHFRQSAILVSEDHPLSVISGYVLKIRFVFHNSCLSFRFLDTSRFEAFSN